MVQEGYANTKSEAIRLAVLNFGEGHVSEGIMIKGKLDKMIMR